MNTFPDQYFEVAILWTKFKKKRIYMQVSLFIRIIIYRIECYITEICNLGFSTKMTEGIIRLYHFSYHE